MVTTTAPFLPSSTAWKLRRWESEGKLAFQVERRKNTSLAKQFGPTQHEIMADIETTDKALPRLLGSSDCWLV